MEPMRYRLKGLALCSLSLSLSLSLYIYIYIYIYLCVCVCGGDLLYSSLSFVYEGSRTSNSMQGRSFTVRNLRDFYNLRYKLKRDPRVKAEATATSEGQPKWIRLEVRRRYSCCWAKMRKWVSSHYRFRIALCPKDVWNNLETA